MEILSSFAVSLGLTLLIELSLAALFKVRTKRGLLIVLLANVLTNPAVVFLCMALGPFLGKFYLPFQLLAEAVAVFVEAYVYRQFQADLRASLRPFLLSLVLNACSYGAGLVLNYLL